MRKMLTGLQVLCGIIAYGAIGACDNGGDFGVSMKTVFVCIAGIALFGAIKVLTAVLANRRVSGKNNIQCNFSRNNCKCQGVCGK